MIYLMDLSLDYHFTSLFARFCKYSNMVRNFRLLLLLLLMFCCFSSTVFFWFPQNNMISSGTAEKHINPSLIIDTEGCKIPKLDPYDPSVIKLIEMKDPYECTGPPLFMTPRPHGFIELNETVLNIFYNITAEAITCTYRGILRPAEPTDGRGIETSFALGNSKILEFGTPLAEDSIVVTCILPKYERLTQYIPLAFLKPETEEKKSLKKQPLSDHLNVILLSLDSVSKLNFLRHFRRTRSFLEKKLSPFELKGYTKVADNTFPNLVPLLTGHFIEYYWNESLKDSMYFDDIDLIWRQYSEKGYRTFYAEDSPYTGTFNYLKKGFRNPPTDYYFRPLGLALDSSEVKKRSKEHCLNSQLEMELIYGYLQNFIETMGDRPFFALAFVSTFTHDYLNNAGYVDEPTFRLLNDLNNSGALNKSVLIFYSDHGLRFGPIRETYIGKYEERMPFSYMLFPAWFLEKHPQIARHLRTNQGRLTTHFDVHATLVNLMIGVDRELSVEEKRTLTPHGLSLLRPIPPSRTCQEASILPHWCPCQVLQYISPDESVAKEAAAAVIENINALLEPSKEMCANLKLDTIIDAQLRQASDEVMKFVKSENDVVNRHVVYGDKVNALEDYLITLVAGPGGGVFEGTIRHNVKQASYTVLGISRINKYGDQSRCINIQHLKKFCFCKTYLAMQE